MRRGEERQGAGVARYEAPDLKSEKPDQAR
jgi:hypothetical protein